MEEIKLNDDFIIQPNRNEKTVENTKRGGDDL